ncbi:MAG: MCE family protein [Actinomycetota bacterium]
MRSRVIGSIVALALLATGVSVLASSSGPPRYTITAEVDQAPNLFKGGRVMVRGIEVGTITEVEPTESGVRLTLEVNGSVAVPANASLAVVPITVIADRYVQLFPAYDGGAKLADGDHIPLDRTSIPAELDDVLTQLKGLLAALEPAPGKERGPLAALIENLDAAFEGRSSDLAGTLEGSADVLETLADSDADITGLIGNLDRLFVALANRSSEIGFVNERFALVTEALAADQEELEGTLENITFLSDEASRLVLESGDELGTAFGRLGRVLDAVLARQDSLAAGMRWTNVIAEALGATDANGRGRFAYTGRQAVPGSAGARYNYRIDTRDTIACERLGVLVESLVTLNPEITVEELAATALTFIPDEYDEHLRFLIELLLPPCADLPGEAGLDARARKLVEETAQRVGDKRFTAMIARWYATGVLEEPGR